MQPEYPYYCHTKSLADVSDPVKYGDRERRVGIYSRYPILRLLPTCDEYTSVCAEVETGDGSLLVYGTIIGLLGNRRASYMVELYQQIEDYRRLAAMGSLCICGDYNCSFSDNYYFTQQSREELGSFFDASHLRLTTAETKECIDHIATSEDFLSGREIQIEEWNLDKRLSDHKRRNINVWQITRVET